jgi:hypothetical protein
MIVKLKMKVKVIFLLKYSSAIKSKSMMANRRAMRARGGSLAIVSKQIFMKLRKKKIVKSMKTSEHRRV